MSDLVAQHIRGRPWVQTVTGRAFPLIDPEPCDVHWPDIAYALVHINRFVGHAGGYSVAQHTLHALLRLEPKLRPYWLLHDAHEAYMGDIATPVVKALACAASRGNWTVRSTVSGAVRQLKNGIDYAIYSSVGLEWPIPIEIAEVIELTDKRMLVTERRDLLARPPTGWGAEYDGVEPFHGIATTSNPRAVYDRFAWNVSEFFGINVPPMWRIEQYVDRQRSA